MSIRLTLIGLLSILTGIVAYAGYTTFRDVTAINNKVVQYSENTIPYLGLLSYISSGVSRFRYVEAEHIFTRSRSNTVEKENELERIRAEITKYIETYRSLINSELKRKDIEALEWSWSRYIRHHDNIVKLFHEGRDLDAAAIYEVDMGDIMNYMTKTIDNAIINEKNAASVERSAASSQYKAAQLTLFIGLSLTLIISLVATAYAIFWVSRPLGNLSGAMQRLADGGFDVEIPRLGHRNEIGRIALAVQRFKDKAAERAAVLEEARAAAEAGAKAKVSFIASMSHEIRTPLNGVLGMAQSLFADGLMPGQREKVRIILDSGSTLMALLNDVLDMSKIDAGKMEIVTADGDLRTTVMSVVQLFQPGADEKGVALTVFLDPAIPERIKFDSIRVRQCIGNLLSNAIKFTSRGGQTELRVSCEHRADGGYLVTVSVTDNGIGMAADTIAKLFLVFTQADGSISRRFGGSGLGLVICRRLAQAMGGDVDVESEFGVGSRFRMTFTAEAAAPSLPVVPASTETADAADSSPAMVLNGSRILLVDDNAVNRQVVKLFLKLLDVQVTEAANGKEALEALGKAEFDIVLLDVHMPVMDGTETIKTIRGSHEPWSGIPTIALTADAMSGDRERYLAMGMTDYLAKPLDQRELLSKMERVLAPHLVSMSATSEDVAPAVDGRNKRASG